VSWRPLAFFSRKLQGAGLRYSTFDRELLAAFSAIRHFHFLLEGQRSPHQPQAAVTHYAALVGQTERQLSLIAEFTSDIRHTPGAEKVVADALSRPPPPSAVPTDSFPYTDDKWPDEAFDNTHPATAFQILTCTVEEGLATATAGAQLVDYAAITQLQVTCLEVAAIRWCP
jgi:hypothetical protein